MSDHFDERAIVMEDGSRYLEVCHRLSDARKDGCRVVTDLVYHDERMAVFKAEVYNSADRKLAEGLWKPSCSCGTILSGTCRNRRNRKMPFRSRV